MHFAVLDVDEYRRKHAGALADATNTSRKSFARRLPAMLGDYSHVPDNQLFLVEVGRGHPENSSSGGLSGYSVNEILRDVAIHDENRASLRCLTPKSNWVNP